VTDRHDRLINNDIIAAAEVASVLRVAKQQWRHERRSPLQT